MSAARPQLKFMLLSGMLLCPTASLSDSLLPSQDQPTFFNVRICRDRQVLSVLKAAVSIGVGSGPQIGIQEGPLRSTFSN